ncbi:MAG: hypothetical protein GEU73_05145 [Chloroflexi bacterium]|nr:hypothetical protein [Chloroflexota bacterium]
MTDSNADLIIFVKGRELPLEVTGSDDDPNDPNALENAWDFAEEILFPHRKDRIKWEAAKELAKNFGRVS